MTRSKRVLLVSDDKQRLREWTQGLGESVEIWSADANSDPIRSRGWPDVVVTDQFPIEDLDGAIRSRLTCGEIGVVAIGTQGPADVSLPGDTTRRELRLAVWMLTEIVRLRRKHREDKRERRSLERLAFSDPLTNLANRRAWERELRARFFEPTEGAADQLVCIALLDLDLFKRVNDQLGHLGGDRTLREVARRLAEVIRRPDLLARLGGDEFAILMSAGQDMAVVVELIRRHTECVVPHDDEPMTITASAGFVVVSPSLWRPDQATAAADAALREAKASGRDQTVGQSVPLAAPPGEPDA